jgi:hypothetical protein
MGKDNWIGRKRAAVTPPFMLPRKEPATPGERAVLRLPAQLLPRPRRAPDEPAGDRR